MIIYDIEAISEESGCHISVMVAACEGEFDFKILFQESCHFIQICGMELMEESCEMNIPQTDPFIGDAFFSAMILEQFG